jgi:phage shock protein PspC (stress-responsive transcriptional regulator)
MGPATARGLFVCFVLFGFAAALGAGFAVFGPVTFVRVLGLVALVGGAAGCALQLYAIRAFAPQVHVLLRRRTRHGFREITAATPVMRTIVAVPR